MAGALQQHGAPVDAPEAAGADILDWQHGAAAAAAATPPPPFVSDCWEQSYDLNSGAPYWFNRATGASQWHPPPGWALPAGSGQQQAAASGEEAAFGEQQQQQEESAEEQQQQQHQPPACAADEQPVGGQPPPAEGLPAAAGEAGSMQPPAAQQQQQQQQQQQGPPVGAWEPGLYYRDAYSQLQGPFTLEQLRQWRGMLPMDLPVLRWQPEGGGGDQRAARGDGDSDGGGTGGGEQQAAGAGGQRGRWEQLELAGLLGDEELLERWRLDNPEQAAWPGSAPPASACEAELQAGTAHSLAQAVLSGLPADDEAVAVARMAAAAGRSIQEVAAMSRGEDYEATAYRVALRGRIQAGGAQESLYAEAASWVDPASLEAQLQRAAERRKRPLTAQELRAVKQRKAEMKEKKKVGWLFT